MKTKPKEITKKTVNKLGLQVTKYTGDLHPYLFLNEYKIETVIDAGANIGQFATDIRTVLPDATIYSFEPLQETFKTLKENFSEDKNFTALNFALGDKNEEVSMNKNAYAPSSSILENSAFAEEIFPFTKDTTEEKIIVKTLDTVLSANNLKKEILLKLDVQGYEDKVLSGAKNIIEETSIILIETAYYELYKGQPLFADIYTLLTNLGFTYKGDVGTKRNSKNMLPLFEDSLFIRE